MDVQHPTAAADHGDIYRAMVDALSVQVATISGDGTIVAVNAAWERFAQDNGGHPERCSVGVNYLAVCRRAVEAGDATAAAALAGLESVLSGASDVFELEYPCHSPDQERWFAMTATPQKVDTGGGVVVAHVNITSRYQAEQQVLNREARLRALIGAATEGVAAWLASADGAISQISDGWRNLTGQAPQQALGAGWMEMVIPEEREQVLATWRRALRDTAPYTNHLHLRGRDGSSRFVQARAGPVLGVDGSVQEWAGIVIDVTEQVQAAAARAALAAAQHHLAEAEAAAEQVRAVVEATPDALVLTTMEGEIAMVNGRAETLFGYSRSELLGAPVERLLPERLGEQHVAHRRDYETRPRQRMMGNGLGLTARTKDGRDLPVEISLSPITLNGRPHVISAVRDISTQWALQMALMERERWLSALFDHTFQFVGLLAPDGRILEANRSSLQFIEKSAEEVRSVPFWDTPWWRDVPESRERLRTEFPKAAAGRFVRFDAEHAGAGGRRMMVDFSLSPVIGESGTVDLLVAEGRDITDTVRSREEERLLDQISDTLAASLDQQEILQKMVDLVTPALADSCVIDLLKSDGSIERVAQAHVDKPEGQRLWQMYQHNHRQWKPDHPIRRALETGQPWLSPEMTDEVRIGIGFSADQAAELRPIGMRFMLLVPLAARGRIFGTLAMGVTYHSGRRYTEHDLELAQEVARRASLSMDNARLFREAQAARELAEQANAAKNAFLSRTSHELRTPLNAILGFGQLLARSQLTAIQTRNVDRIVTAGGHLLKLIDEVLDLSRIEAGHFAISPEPVRVWDVVREAATLVRPQAGGRDVRVDITIVDHHRHAYVQADRHRLMQVVLNLLSNAVKYNRPGGSITLRWVEREGRGRLGVQDTGLGLTVEQQARIFEPFERLGQEKSGIEGTGLGLTLARQMMRAMSGDLLLDSTPGVGSTFWLDLELAAAPQAVQPDDVAQGAALPPQALRRVLYIEDNLPNLELVQEILSEWNAVELLPAMQGSIGLELARQHQPHLILLDLHLPDLDGRQVLRHLKTDPRTKDIPVVVLSADATPGRAAQLRADGAADYLTKPLDVGRFLTVIGELLKGVGEV